MWMAETHVIFVVFFLLIRRSYSLLPLYLYVLLLILSSWIADSFKLFACTGFIVDVLSHEIVEEVLRKHTHSRTFRLTIHRM